MAPIKGKEVTKFGQIMKEGFFGSDEENAEEVDLSKLKNKQRTRSVFKYLPQQEFTSEKRTFIDNTP